MNQELKNKWIEALRSGKYKQGKGQLRKGDSFCCLGVLCDVDDPSKWRGNSSTILSGIEGTYAYDYNVNCLPSTFNLPMDVKNSLMRMNDSEGKSFKEIADLIEKNL